MTYDSLLKETTHTYLLYFTGVLTAMAVVVANPIFLRPHLRTFSSSWYGPPSSCL